MLDRVYHSSTTSGLKQLLPKESTHKQPWVYATKDIATSAMFLGHTGDFICQTGVEDGIPCLYERFTGAFDMSYKNKKGSIYVLDGKNFSEGKTTWSAEVVSSAVAPVLEEIIIDNVEEYLKKLDSEGKLKIYMFPTRPADNSDLIEKAVRWTMDFGEGTLEQLQRYHPNLLHTVLLQLREKKYSFVDQKWLNLLENN